VQVKSNGEPHAQRHRAGRRPNLPNPDHLPPREALRLALLAVREELTAEPVTEKRDREIAASDMLLERLATTIH
jgi:hypothetical protein